MISFISGEILLAPFNNGFGKQSLNQLPNSNYSRHYR